MKRSRAIILSATAVCGLALSSQATVLLSDTFVDGSRAEQNLPTESQWFLGGAGTLAPLGPGGPLRGDLLSGGTASASWTTYFADDATPVTLVNVGDALKVTWQFTLTGVGAQNTSQNFRLAVVDSPTAARLTADGAPGSSTYAGYGMFMNMAPTMANGNPFQLMEKTSSTANSALLSASGGWTARGNGATSGNTGYVAGTLYTYVMQMTLTSPGVLEVISSMSGGTLNNSGLATVTYSDATPNSLTYDTFAIRPSSATGAAQIFDTSLVQVEFIPEPSTFALIGLGLLGLGMYRRSRS
jgi:hypothetical protein